MNKKLYILIMVMIAHSSIFCMEDTRAADRQNWMLLHALTKLQTATLKAQCYPGVPEYQQEVDVKRQDIKVRFPQEVDLLSDGKICARYTKSDGSAATVTI